MAVSRNAEMLPLTNSEVAERLERVADLLESQRANPYRIRSYRSAGQLLLGMTRPVSELIQSEGVVGLERLPGIGQSLARSIERLTLTGQLGLLTQLMGAGRPERVLQTVGGIGPGLAGEIHEQLGIETLHELEVAAYDGRLAKVPGIGRKRLQAIREALAGRFRRRPAIPDSSRAQPTGDLPSVAELLDIDQEYRQKAAAGRLPRIAPRRFNPAGEAWLSILHTERDSRHYTALYSNTARAHELGATTDWVVIYRDDHQGDGQWTVITAHLGADKGRRIVRGRERECSDYYRAQQAPSGVAIGSLNR